MSEVGLQPRLAEDGDGGDEEGEGPALDDGQAAAQAALHQRHQARHEEDCAV